MSHNEDTSPHGEENGVDCDAPRDNEGPA